MTLPYQYTDTDGDRLQVEPRTWHMSDGYMVRIKPHLEHRSPLGVFLPVGDAQALASAILADHEAAHEQVKLQAEGGASRLTFTLGDLAIDIEGAAGDTPVDLARALVKVLKARVIEGGGVHGKILDALATMLDCQPGAVRDEVEQLQLQVAGLVGLVDQQRDELARRPVAEQLDRVAEEAKAWHERANRAEAMLNEGENEIRKALKTAGLVDMSGQPAEKIARRVNALGARVNELLGELDREGMLNAKQLIHNLQQEVEASRVIAEQLDKGLSRERELHREVRDQLNAEVRRHAQTEAARAQLAEACDRRGEQLTSARSALSAAVAEVERLRHLARGNEETNAHLRELLGNARNGLRGAGADLTAHAAPNDELDVRVLNTIMEALEASAP